MKLRFLGAAQTVTGSKYLLTTPNKEVLIDCGLFQGFKTLRLLNWEPFPIPPKTIDAVVLTHAHIDHSGYLPLLVKQGFKGPVYATQATYDLCKILLQDAAHLQEEDARRANKYGYSKHKPALPLYNERDAVEALKLFDPIPYGSEIKLSQDLSFHANRAGHILGSAMITFSSEGKTVVFSGDLGRPFDHVMKPPEIIKHADYLVLESTYATRRHDNTDPLEKFSKIIHETCGQGGVVIIPSFAVGRAQTVLYMLHKLHQRGELAHIPVYLDSPMAQDVSDIMCNHADEHKLQPLSACHDVCHVAEYVQSIDASKRLHQTDGPKVILSASGMAEGGRVLHHLAHYASDPKNTILFVGYQAPMTRGDKIMRGDKEIKIHGQMIPVRARVEMIDSLSSHADYEETLKWLEHFESPPKKVFLVHGEKESCEAMAKLIHDKFGWDVVAPSYGEEFTL